MSYINWKKARATSLQEAFWLVKEYGKAKKNLSVIEMQGAFNDAMSLLIKFAAGQSEAQETIEALTRSMSDLAFPRENVQKAFTPELDFGEE